MGLYMGHHTKILSHSPSSPISSILHAAPDPRNKKLSLILSSYCMPDTLSARMRTSIVVFIVGSDLLTCLPGCYFLTPLDSLVLSDSTEPHTDEWTQLVFCKVYTAPYNYIQC